MGLLLNRAKANTATTGTGSVMPSGVVVPYQTWAAAGAVAGTWYDYLLEDGVSWEMGVGLYDGATISRPGPGTDPWFTSSSGALLNLSGTATVACVPNRYTLSAGGVFMPPLASSLTLGGTVAPTITNDPQAGLLLDAGALIGGDVQRFAYRVLSNPTGDFDCQVNALGTLPTVNYSQVLPLLIYDTIGGRIQSLGMSWDDSITVVNWNGLSGYNGTAGGSTVRFSRPSWFRLQKVGTALTYSYGLDGKSWTVLYTTTSTAWLTNGPQAVGFGNNYNRTTGPKNLLTIRYFSLTGTAV